MDTVIRGGTVIDGSGAPARDADVGIFGDRIREIGRISSRGAREIDARGLIVAPGFVDPHTHYDAQLTWDPLASCSNWHGVTSVVLGNCGFAVAPCRPGARQDLVRMLVRVEGMDAECLNLGIRWKFETFGEYLDMLEESGLGVNVGAFLAHSTVRLYVMGEDAWRRDATEAELQAMEAVVVEAMANGAIGLSSSRHRSHVGPEGGPIPSRIASTGELTRLARAMRRSGRGIVQIAMDSSLDVAGLEAVAGLATAAAAPVTIGCIRFDPSQPERHRRTLARLDELIADGLQLHPQVTSWRLKIDFTVESSTIFVRLPIWRRVLSAPRTEWPAIFADSSFRRTFGEELRAAGRGNVIWSSDASMEVHSVTRPELQELVGRSLGDVAKQRGEDPLDTFFGLVSRDLDLEMSVVLMNTDDEAVGEILAHPQSLLALSDAGAHATLICESGQTSHFLARWVRERRRFSLEEGVRRITSMPAAVLGLAGRGLLREGAPADVVVFDADRIDAVAPEIVHDLPGQRPRMVQRAVGVRWSFVNGAPIVVDGAVADPSSGSGPGRIIRPAHG